MASTLRSAFTCLVPRSAVGRGERAPACRLDQPAITESGPLAGNGSGVVVKTRASSGRAAGTRTADTTFSPRCLQPGATFVAVGIGLGLLARGKRKLAGAFGPDAGSATVAAASAAH